MLEEVEDHSQLQTITSTVHRSTSTSTSTADKMQSFITLALATLALANPIDLEVRQRTVGSTAKEFTVSGCRPVILFFARGSTEIGNMGTVCGPPTANGLKSALGADNIAVEGIDYAALVSTNLLPGGADLLGIREMKDQIAKAVTRCPNSHIVVGGYSQGAALTHRAVEDLTSAQKARIAAAFTFGDTKNLQVWFPLPDQALTGTRADITVHRIAARSPTSPRTRPSSSAMWATPSAPGVFSSLRRI